MLEYVIQILLKFCLVFKCFSKNPKALTMALNELLGNITFVGFPLLEGMWDALDVINVGSQQQQSFLLNRVDTLVLCFPEILL